MTVEEPQDPVDPKGEHGEHGLRATLGVTFIEREGRLFMAFEAGIGRRLIEVSVSESVLGTEEPRPGD